MKKIIGTLFMITVLLMTFSSTDYVDAASYDSKSTISFKKAKDEGDGSGDIPGGGVVDDGSEVPPEGSDSAESTLPKTATNIYSFLLLGLIIILVGVSFFIYSNRKEKKNKIRI